MVFFTLKTTAQLQQEERTKRARAAALQAPLGLRTEIEVKEKELQELRNESDVFFLDIEQHFGNTSKFLSREYLGRSKLENVTSDTGRRFAMTWNRKDFPEDNTVSRYDIAFVYTATHEAVRVDYIVNTIYGKEVKVVNDQFNPLSFDTHKHLSQNNAHFRMVRYYKDHAEFVSKRDSLPDWFVKALEEHIVPL